jgi:hypothetical protein
MRLALVVLSLGLSLQAQAQLSALVKAGTKTGAGAGEREALASFKAGASKVVSIEAAKKSGVILDVWKRNSVFVLAEKSGSDVKSLLIRVEKVNSKTPAYEKKLVETLESMQRDTPKVGAAEARISRIDVESGDATFDDAKMIYVYFDKGINDKAGDKFLKDLESRLSGTDTRILPAEVRGHGNQ